MLSIVVLGTAAGGGIPQWNCGCDNCSAARNGSPELIATQASIAVSVDREHWFLINASPDLRQQIISAPVLHPKIGQLRHSPISGVVLTCGEIDAIAGLLSLREGTPFQLYAHERVLSLLSDNSVFNVLKPGIVGRHRISPDVPFEPMLGDGRQSGIEITPFVAPGKAALFIEEQSEYEDGDTLGFVLRDKGSGESLVFLAACAAITPEIVDRLRGASLVFLDGTLWRDDEMIALGLSEKTGARMGHTPMQAAIAKLDGLEIKRKLFIHINNSNPALQAGSVERKTAEAAGWQIPADGMEINL